MGAVSEPLIQWFELNRRLLPFRQEPSAYHIWVSEIMLQQTRVSAALPYYERFVAELPDPAALAACDPDKLRKLWQGLGYYSRVANMQKAAQIVCRLHLQACGDFFGKQFEQEFRHSQPYAGGRGTWPAPQQH